LRVPSNELLKSVAIPHKLIIVFLFAGVTVTEKRGELPLNTVNIHHSKPLLRMYVVKKEGILCGRYKMEM
jgi:hypothetical protein